MSLENSLLEGFKVDKSKKNNSLVIDAKANKGNIF